MLAEIIINKLIVMLFEKLKEEGADKISEFVDSQNEKKLLEQYRGNLDEEILKKYGNESFYDDLCCVLSNHLMDLIERMKDKKIWDEETDNEFIQRIADEVEGTTYDKKRIKEALKYIEKNSYMTFNKLENEELWRLKNLIYKKMEVEGERWHKKFEEQLNEKFDSLKKTESEDLEQKECVVIRTFKKTTEGDDEGKNVLDMTNLFNTPNSQDPNGRLIIKSDAWNEIHSKVSAFIATLNNNTSYNVVITSHYSVWFMVGRCLNPKAGIRCRLAQWNEKDDSLQEYDQFGEVDSISNNNGNDIAIAISVSCSVIDDVQYYIEKNELPIKTILHFKLPYIANDSVKNETHASKLARELHENISACSGEVKRKGGVIHLFASAPGSILFYLGQKTLMYPKIQFYEYIPQESTYYPSISFVTDKV